MENHTDSPDNSDLYDDLGPRDKCPTGASKKFVKNCPCSGCSGFMEEFQREAKKKAQSQAVEQNVPKVDEYTLVDEQLAGKRSHLRWAMYLVIFLGVAGLLYKLNIVRNAGIGNGEDNNSISNEDYDVFKPLPRPIEVDRADIPDQLPSLLHGYGVVFLTPEDYDPQKPNLFLIANRHFVRNRPMSNEMKSATHEVQRRVLRIIHVLVALGVKRQFLEGIDESLELTHEMTDKSVVGELPYFALPEYRKTGRINRAYIAAEGIYEGDLESLGAENSSQARMIHANARQADQVYFHRAHTNIILGLAHELAIDLGRPRAMTRELKVRFADQIRAQVRGLSEARREELINEFVRANINYQLFLDAFSAAEYYKHEGRNERYAMRILTIPAEQREDAFFIHGANHSRSVERRLRAEFNVFIIRPEGVNDSAILHDKGSRTLDEWRRIIIKHDLYVFGLSEEPGEEY